MATGGLLFGLGPGTSLASRRAGDPSFLCADVSLIRNSAGVSAEYSLEASIKGLF